MLHSETAVSADWLHVFWIPSQHLIIPLGAMESDMTMVFSDKSSKTDIK